MALTRGVMSNFPCPVCLVPRSELYDLSKKYELRTTETMQAVYQEAKDARLMAEGEQILKSRGLRRVEVTSSLLSVILP